MYFCFCSSALQPGPHLLSCFDVSDHVSPTLRRDAKTLWLFPDAGNHAGYMLETVHVSFVLCNGKQLILVVDMVVVRGHPRGKTRGVKKRGSFLSLNVNEICISVPKSCCVHVYGPSSASNRSVITGNRGNVSNKAFRSFHNWIWTKNRFFSLEWLLCLQWWDEKFASGLAMWHHAALSKFNVQLFVWPLIMLRDKGCWRKLASLTFNSRGCESLSGTINCKLGFKGWWSQA